MRRILTATLIAAAALVPSTAHAVRIPPQPSPDCVLVQLRGNWVWLCQAYPDVVVHRSTR